MKMLLKIIASLVLVLVLGAGLWIANVGFYKPYSIDLFYNRVFVRFLLESPELVTSLAPHPLGIRYFDRRLSDASVAAQQKQAAFVKSELDTLHAYDKTQLDDGQKLSWDILEDFLATVYHQLGIDSNQELSAFGGTRPIEIVNGGKVVKGIIS